MEKKKYLIGIEEFCAKDDVRELLKGVMHDEGKLVATDGRMLCIMAEKYDAKYEGLVTDEDGDVIEGCYPRWQSVIPWRDHLDNPKIYSLTALDMKNVEKVIRKVAQEYVLFPNPDAIYTIVLTRGDWTYMVAFEYFVKLFRFMMMLGTNEIYLPVESYRPALVASGDNKCMIMPMRDDGYESDYRFVCEI